MYKFSEKTFIIAQSCHIGNLLAGALLPYQCRVICRQEEAVAELRGVYKTIIFEDTNQWFQVAEIIKQNAQKSILIYSLRENLISHPLFGTSDTNLWINASREEVLAALE